MQEYQFIKTQIMLILPILPSHISLNVKDDGVAVGTNKHAEGPEKESGEPRISGAYSKSMNIHRLYQTNLILSMTPLFDLCTFLFNLSIVALYHDLRGQNKMTCALKLINYVLVKLIGLEMIFHPVQLYFLFQNVCGET